jgi:protein deglycase
MNPWIANLLLVFFVTYNLSSALNVVRCRNAKLAPAIDSMNKVYSVLLKQNSRRFRSIRTFSQESDSKVTMPKPKVLIAVADGTEELEAVTAVDILCRAGAAVTVASVSPNLNIVCSRGVRLSADASIESCASTQWDLIVCPGGMPGAEHLAASTTLIHLLKETSKRGGIIGAICAAPAVVLAKHNLLEGKTATCYPHPSFTSKLHHYVSNEAVVVDGNVITSQGPGTAMEFSLSLVGALFGPEKVQTLKNDLVLH